MYTFDIVNGFRPISDELAESFWDAVEFEDNPRIGNEDRFYEKIEANNTDILVWVIPESYKAGYDFMARVCEPDHYTDILILDAFSLLEFRNRYAIQAKKAS